jgi:FAD/FMN-containing dehydrogenase
MNMINQRGSSVMAQIAAVKDQLSAAGGIVYEPGSEGYAQATATRLWNGAVERKPALVTACSNTNYVRTALLAARAAGLPVSIRNGGQDWPGRALRDGGLVLDLAPMRQCSVDRVEIVRAARTLRHRHHPPRIKIPNQKVTQK